MFVALGSTILLPAVHAMLVHGVRNGLQGFAMENIAIMVLLDFLALFFYLSHIPYVFPDSPFPFLGQLWSLEACLRSFGFPGVTPSSIFAVTQTMLIPKRSFREKWWPHTFDLYVSGPYFRTHKIKSTI